MQHDSYGMFLEGYLSSLTGGSTSENLNMNNPIRKTRLKQNLSKLSFLTTISLCKSFDAYLSIGVTGSLEQLAKKFELSEQLTQEILIYMIDELRCPISYNQAKTTYFYKKAGKLLLGFTKI